MRVRVWTRPRRPLAIDLYCGLGGWTEGLLAEGWDVVGFDIERHVYGDLHYPAQLVLQDCRTLDGRQFKDAALIVASPPCQAFSHMAMPFSLCKQRAAAIRADVTGESLRCLTELFDTAFRLQREACTAAGRHIPMVVENVRGAARKAGSGARGITMGRIICGVTCRLALRLRRDWRRSGVSIVRSTARPIIAPAVLADAFGIRRSSSTAADPSGSTPASRQAIPSQARGRWPRR